MNWMRTYTIDIFDQSWNDRKTMEPYHTNDFTYVNMDGAEYKGFDTAIKAIGEIYAPFAAGMYHSPRFWSCWEIENGGWEMVGDAIFYADLPGDGGEKKHVDENGKKWDLGQPSMFRFLYVKDEQAPGGFLIKRTEVFSDTFPAVQEMMKRGLIKQ